MNEQQWCQDADQALHWSPSPARRPVHDEVPTACLLQYLKRLMRVLLTEEQVQATVRRLAGEVTATYGDQPLTIVGVLTGSIVLLADLIRQLAMPLRVGVVQASSYRGETARGALVVQADLMLDIRDHDVLVVDDIFDTGHTLAELSTLLHQFSPRSLRTCVLMRKLGRQQVACRPDFIGFEIPDEFVVGYGLDFRDAYRNLPYVAALDLDDQLRWNSRDSSS